MRKSVPVHENQLSFFDTLYEASKTPKFAFSMMDGQKHSLCAIEPWMLKIMPQGEYYILCAGHALVLCKNDETVVPEMRYRYFTVGGDVYAATGVGRGNDTEFDETEECEE